MKTLFKSFLSLIMLTCLSSSQLHAEASAEEIYTGLYYKNQLSGMGSTVENTISYRTFLQDFFNVYEIRSVVDAGCGDWEFSQFINWDGIDYTGYDVVKPVIAKLKATFVAPNIHFVHGDIVWNNLPRADLLICKDVLQHASNQDVSIFLNQIGKYKYCLITNDVNVETLSSTNPQIARGGYRYLDLTQPPFNIKGVKVLTYGNYPHMKQVLLIVNEGEFVTPLFPGE